MSELYAEVTDTSNILSVNIASSHSGSNSVATIEAVDTDLNVDDPITVDLGYSDDHAVMFTGYVKQIERGASPKEFSITASDVLIRAQELFIVPTNPDQPLTYRNISAETLVGNLLALAGITDYSGDETFYTWGYNSDIKISLTSAYDYCDFLAGLIMWKIYADRDGHVYFKNRKAFPMDGESSIGSISYADSTSMKAWKTDKNLRNKVVVWGAYNIYAEDSRADSFDPDLDGGVGGYTQILPDGFYKTALAQSKVIDMQEMADKAVVDNLLAYNRLTCGVSATVVGNPLYEARKILTVNAPELNVNGVNHYIYTCEHIWNQNGYTTNLELYR
jgi:hypothetical protein